MSESILEEAQRIVNGPRAKDYGPARENHQRIADLWNAYLNVRTELVAPEDVAVMMILLKIARFMENGYHRDTVVDIAGYAGVLEKMQLPESERHPQEPRQWDSLADVPVTVRVRDKDGDVWEHSPSKGWRWCRRGRSDQWHAVGFHAHLVRSAPFTEILARHDQEGNT